MKFSRNKKIISAFILLSAFLAPIIIFAAEGGGVGGWITEWIAGKAIGGVVWFINLVIGFIAGVFFSIGGALVNFALDLNSKIVSQPVVGLGWGIVLDIANLGFVLAIIVIAFATIFRSQTYGVKQALWKLIVAALLVNFSLVIAGSFISIADTFTASFQKLGDLGPTKAATTLADAFKVQKFLNVGKTEIKMSQWQWFRNGKSTGELCDPKVALTRPAPGGGTDSCNTTTITTTYEKFNEEQATGAFEGLSTALLVGVASIFFTAAFTFLGALTLFAIAIMLLIRFIALGILLVLSPIVWLFWIFPATQSMWQSWWKEFLRWTFFAPASSFFIFLAVKAVEGLASFDPSSLPQQAIENSLSQPGVFEIIGNMVLLIGFLFGALYTANKMSIIFASTSYNLAQGAGKAFGGWAGRKGVRTVGYPFAKPSARMQNWAGQSGIRGIIGKGVTGMQSRLSRAPVLKGLGQVYRKKGEHKNIFASVWGGMKSSSGLFKAKGERKEKTETTLNRFYTKKTALQGELNLLQRISSANLTQQQQQRLNELPSKIQETDDKIKELEQSV